MIRTNNTENSDEDAGKWGVCKRCGFIADDFESARIHTRDAHNLLGTPTEMDIFDRNAEPESGRTNETDHNL